MRSNPGTRPPVAKLIEESCNISDSDIRYSYIREITKFYSSEYKTSSEILSQFKKDIEDIVNSYKMACYFSFEKDVCGLSESLEYLMWETAHMGMILDDNTLLELELDKVLLRQPIEQMGEWTETNELGFPKGIVKPSKILRSVYDCALVFYKSSRHEGNGTIPQNIVMHEWKDVDDKIKALFKYPENYNNFLKGCFLPNGEVKDIRFIVEAYFTHRHQKPETIQKCVPTLLYDFLRNNGIIVVPEDKPYKRLRTFQRRFAELKKAKK